ncbi:LOB domain-containing protein 12-like [Cicer arietinum]|uniref:LOB domain-containing protein 22-like n=1 Tax=Cicer arietinum TaxID=3827 RepID=A0A3Q7XF64_CICAR|nr:LOB domain-containing protein 22-like [Cicer arietinum]
MSHRNTRVIECLVCRQQRRRHNQECEMGQYFPIDRHEDFDRACYIFGLNNIIRLMQSVEKHQRHAAGNSILLEGRAWRLYPSSGLLGYQLELGSQVSSSLIELQNANRLLELCRNHANQDHDESNNPLLSLSLATPSSNPHLSNQLGSSASQMSSLAITPIEHMGGVETMEAYKINQIMSTRERGESSNTASNRNTTLQELQADDKGKQIVVEENESEATNEEEDSTPMEINAEPGE